MAENRKGKGGPKSLRGKHYSSRNAIKLGLFSSELKIADSDRKEFDDWLKELSKELKPDSALKRIAFDDLITALWRHKTALRWAEQQRSKRLSAEQEQGVKPEAADSVFTLNRQRLRRCRNLLREARQSATSGYVSPAALKSLEVECGSLFVDLLSQWKVANPTALQMNNMFAAKSKTFEMPLVSVGAQGAMQSEEALKARVTIALLDQEISHWEELSSFAEQQRNMLLARQSDPLELALRYLAATKRDVYRALDRYFAVKIIHLGPKFETGALSE